jgi:hypothetical protein
VVDIDAGQLVADRLMDEDRGHGGIDAAGEGAEDAPAADLVADLADHLGAIGRHGPVGFQTDNAMHEIGEQLGAVGRMHHFGMEHRRVVAARLIRRDGEGRVLRGGDDFETLGQLGDAIAVAHPDRIVAADIPEACEERARLLDLDIGATELRGMSALDRAAELGCERLLAVADAEDRNTAIEHRLRRPGAAFRRHRSGAAREDHAFRLHLFEGVASVLEGMDFAIDPGFTDAARDQLRHLAAEIDDEDAVGMRYLGHVGPIKKDGRLGNGVSTASPQFSQQFGKAGEFVVADAGAVAGLDLELDAVRVLHRRPARVRQSNDATALVVGVGDALEDAIGLQPVDQLLHRLLGNADPIDQKPLLGALKGDVTHQGRARGREPAVPSGLHALDEFHVPVLARAPEQPADMVGIFIVKHLD